LIILNFQRKGHGGELKVLKNHFSPIILCLHGTFSSKQKISCSNKGRPHSRMMKMEGFADKETVFVWISREYPVMPVMLCPPPKVQKYNFMYVGNLWSAICGLGFIKCFQLNKGSIGIAGQVWKGNKLSNAQSSLLFVHNISVLKDAQLAS